MLLQHAPGCVPAGTRQIKYVGGKPNAGESHSNVYGWAESGGLHKKGHIPAAPDGTETVAAWECAPGCPVAALDAQSGERAPGAWPQGTIRRKNVGNVPFGSDSVNAERRETDTGGASRFYPVFTPDPPAPFLYCAKASRRERNAGCAGLPEQSTAERDGRNQCKNGTPLNGSGKLINGTGLITPQSNHHPTVKPQALMRWLCTLITPPGGTILDPFCGSGSTGVAAVTLGYDFIGCEQDAAYMEIAAARIAHAQPSHPAAVQAALEMTA